MEENLNLENFEDDSDKEEFQSQIHPNNNLTSYTVGNSIRTIVDMIDEDTIFLRPDFQRGFIWDIRRASKLIDSILIGLPIPNILLVRYRADEKFIVVDGQQRLTTIYSYIKGEFNDNGTKKSFKLHGVGNDRAWSNKTFEELDEILKRKLQNFVINSTMLENIESNPKVIFEIFNRLNTGGVPLTSQEVRNCIYSGKINDDLKNLNLIDSWRRFNSPKPGKRLQDVELILRFYSLFEEKYLSYRPPMRDWLNSAMEESLNSGLEEHFKINFDNINKIIYTKIGVSAFRGKGRSFNRSIFDALMVSFSICLKNNSLVDNILQKYNELLENPEFQDCLIEGTTDARKVKKRIELAIKYFSKNE